MPVLVLCRCSLEEDGARRLSPLDAEYLVRAGSHSAPGPQAQPSGRGRCPKLTLEAGSWKLERGIQKLDRDIRDWLTVNRKPGLSIDL